MARKIDLTKVPATPATVPVVPSMDDLLSVIGDSQWVAPSKGTPGGGGTGNGRIAAPRFEWSEAVLAAAGSLSPAFQLPDVMPRKRSIQGFPSVLAAAPANSGKDGGPKGLAALNFPIPWDCAKDRASARIILDLAWGKFNTRNGIIALPAMAKGERLPIAVILKVFSAIGDIYTTTKSFHKLHSSETQTNLLQIIATRTGRYCAVDVKNESLYLTDSLTD